MGNSLLALSVFLFWFAVFAAQMPSDKVAVPQNPEARVAYEEIRNTFGTIPTFLKEFPQEAVSGAWQEFRDVQLNPTTTLTPKTKELIGIAVASQISCSYCIYFHKKFAIFNGATSVEMNYAIAVAADTGKWATFLTGSPTAYPQFKRDVDKMISILKTKKITTVSELEPPPLIGDANGAYKDMEKTIGVTPSFVKPYSAKGIAGAWNEHKMLSMNPKSPLAAATIDLISLAVSAQSQCQYCVYLYTEFAKLHGASEEQLHETIAMASLTRHWGTYLNGLQQPQHEFEKEVNQIFQRLDERKIQMNKQISSY